MRGTASALAATFYLVTVLLGCSDPTTEESNEYQKQLHGLVVPSQQTPSQSMIFLSHRVDLSTQLQEVLAGVEHDDIWWLIDLPTASLPAGNQKNTFDLATEGGIRLTNRRPFPEFSPKSNDWNYNTVSFDDGSKGVQGVLIVAGPQVVPPEWPLAVTSDGQKFWVGFCLCYEGPLAIKPHPTTSSSLESCAGVAPSPCP